MIFKRFLPLCVVVLLLVHASPARADSPITQYLTVTTMICQSNYAGMGGITTLNYTVPSHLYINYYVNGAVIHSFDLMEGVGAGTGGWSLAWYHTPATADYQAEWEWLYYVDGELVWRNTAGMFCVGGVGTNPYTTYQDFTLPPAPGLPAERNLVLFTADTPVLNTPDGYEVGETLRTCQTAFVINTSDDGEYGELFVMGGWIPLSATVDVPEDYGQPNGAARLPGCE